MFPGETLAAYVARSHPLAANDAIRPADVGGETLIIFPRSANPVLFDRARAMAEDAGYHFRDILESTGIHARDGMVLAGQGRGVYLGFEHLGQEAGPDRHGLVVRPLDPVLQLPVTRLAWAPRSPGTAGARLEGAREVAREMHGATATPA
jgi:DNA-binding transcriptional LysR family regulator